MFSPHKQGKSIRVIYASVPCAPLWKLAAGRSFLHFVAALLKIFIISLSLGRRRRAALWCLQECVYRSIIHAASLGRRRQLLRHGRRGESHYWNKIGKIGKPSPGFYKFNFIVLCRELLRTPMIKISYP